MEKECKKCGDKKSIDDFKLIKINGVDKISDKCIICFNLYRAEISKKYRTNNSDKIKLHQKTSKEKSKEKYKLTRQEYSKNNRDKINETARNYYNENKLIYLERRKEYYKKNKKLILEQKNNYFKLKMDTDPLFKLKRNIKSLINLSLKRKGLNKNLRTNEILGCSFEEFKIYLESKFKPWMDWGNKGLYNNTLNYGWDVDHIIPLSTGITEEDIIRLNHYTNLQPLCSKINRDVKKDNLNFEY